MVAPAETPPARLDSLVTARVFLDASAWVAVIRRAVMTSGSRPPVMVVGPMMFTAAVAFSCALLVELPIVTSRRAVRPVTARVPLDASALLAVMRRAVMVSEVKALDTARLARLHTQGVDGRVGSADKEHSVKAALSPYPHRSRSQGDVAVAVGNIACLKARLTWWHP